ncbi:hypothetical protein [Legionella fallonii]|uniref:Uncharacterized protein n=1 Tax=Legionella fallonii LLAP-10 TaxID=1212491 RepID=A0A098G7B5_9GAMM|nr:hypothetical protein [Legionella fallonii]CEG57400.1 protein of unknown function [Legionella fallonii LLAP-10]
MLSKIDQLMSKKQFHSMVVKGFSKTTQKFSFNKFDLSYPLFPPREVTDRVQVLRDRLPSGPDLIYRGSEGNDEIVHLLETDRLGKNFEHNSKLPSFDIVGYIRDNDSKYFLSFSPCKETVKPYAAGLSIVPCKGHIIVTGLPKVYTIPHKLLRLNEEMFIRYDQRQHESMTGDAHHYQSIVTMTQNNNEITAIIGASHADDWRPVVTDDLMSIFEVCGPGRILSKFMSSNEIAYVKEWKNPNFTKRVYAIEVVIYENQADFEIMNRNARQMKLIGANERLITINDARALVDSEELNELNALYELPETQRISSVPRNIAIGDQTALVEYVTAILKENPLLAERLELRTPIIT